MKGKQIFLEIFNEQVEIFKNSYIKSSRNIFYEPDLKNNLHHAGEFGIFRERIVSKFLKLFTPQRLQFDSGFIIAPNEKLSKQIDIIIYDKNESPLIQSEEGQKFFPIETIASIGEIKSVLTKEQLKAELLNLASIKKLRELIGDRARLFSIAPEIVNIKTKRTERIPFDPIKFPGDQISTFLICERFDFELNEGNVKKELTQLYNSIKERHMVDFILSLENGFIGYFNKDKGFSHFPNITNEFQLDMVMKNDSDDHIKQFVNLFYNSISSTTIVKPDVGDYFT